ncbi:DUF397 domain-containing protein [Streptomyces sp. NPDC057654]|uniref:DUF397 domain-containing protein n=1 Tax=Streptomyces sp. NPDC057654 TaxID=3346196 RepID=UPI0036922C54
MTDSVPLHWRKSSHSNGSGGNCVEIAVPRGPHDNMLVRDSKVPGGPVLGFSQEAWAAFVGSVRRGYDGSGR